MSTFIATTDNEDIFTLVSETENSTYGISMTLDELTALKDSIDKAISSGKKSVNMVWNPRSKRHEISEEK